MGYQENIPFMQSQHFGTVRLGYRTKPTRHFSLQLGVLLHAYGNDLSDIPTLGTQTYSLNRVGYELNFLHYTF
jgi:hypothetical protein